MLFECKQEVQDEKNCHTSLDDTPIDPAVKTTESYVKENANLGCCGQSEEARTSHCCGVLPTCRRTRAT